MAWAQPLKNADTEASPLTVAVPGDVLTDYELFLAGRDPLAITDYSGSHSRRDIIELVLFQQALAHGGVHQRPTFVVLPSYARILEELKSGRTAALGTPAWLSDLTGSDDLLISSPIVKEGEFEAGFYTAPDNAKAMAASSPEKLRQLSAACTRSWKRDWETLNAIGIKDIQHVSNWKNMVHLVAEKRADFLLAPFQQTDDLHLEVDGHVLVPIPGIKAALPGSRHFAVSKRHPDAQRIYEALQSGLAALRKAGVICTAYGQCGFFNKKTHAWPRLPDPANAP